MTRVSRKTLVVWLAAGALVGCGGNKAATRPDEPGADANANIQQPASGAEQVTEYDLNHDQRPDVWSYTVPGTHADGKEIQRLVRKELDINWDGKVDIARTYDAQERVEKEAMDLDFDGRVDQTNFYEKSVIVRKERDLDYDSRVDLWIFYEKGKVARKERDSNSDGRVDYWEYWEGDQVDRIGQDIDGDGNVDRWSKSDSGESQG